MPCVLCTILAPIQVYDTVADPREIFASGDLMSLVTEFFRRLSIELSPFWKLATKHWPVVLISFIVACLLIRYWKKRKW
jgi:hypothetical protein